MGILISLFPSLAIAGQKSCTRADVQKQTNHIVGNGVHRSPIKLPTIFLICDNDDKTLEIECTDDCNALVCVFDDFGNIIEVADSMNSIFQLSDSDSSIYHVRIESDYWYATATIRI